MERVEFYTLYGIEVWALLILGNTRSRWVSMCTIIAQIDFSGLRDKCQVHKRQKGVSGNINHAQTSLERHLGKLRNSIIPDVRTVARLADNCSQTGTILLTSVSCVALRIQLPSDVSLISDQFTSTQN